MKHNHVIVILILLTITALGFRVAYNQVTETSIQADARQYVFYAFNMYKHGVFSKAEVSENPTPDSFRSPGYPVMLNLAMVVSGVEGFFETARSWQAVLSSLMVPLIFILGVRLGVGNKAALASAALTAISPHLVTSSSYILTEILFGFLTLTAFIAFVEAVRRNNMLWGVAAGLLSGCAYLTNEVYLFLPFLMVFYVFFLEKKFITGRNHTDSGESGSRKLLPPLAIIIVVVFLIFPASWTIRNSSDAVSNETTGTTRALITMVSGSYPGFIYKTERLKYFSYREDPLFEEYTSSPQRFVQIFWDRFRQRPIRHLVWYAVEKPYYTWSWNILQGKGDVYIYPVKKSLFMTSGLANGIRVVMKILHPFLMAACLAGLILLLSQTWKSRGLRNNEKVAWLFVFMLYFTFMYIIFAPWPRYSVPFRPIFYLGASWSIATFYSLSKNRPKHNLKSKESK